MNNEIRTFQPGDHKGVYNLMRQQITELNGEK